LDETTHHPQRIELAKLRLIFTNQRLPIRRVIHRLHKRQHEAAHHILNLQHFQP